ncbi:GerMN domain-containing protein [Virgibacillus pantothenticus]|uniref:GerMN domain-containing protein n=1 Tax=Virgibacillus pantothenticus TaxID=1473 RepID=UPI0025B154F1|nr:GerMN domain-containing protein [Virgibacillus pantothenticus]
MQKRGMLIVGAVSLVILLSGCFQGEQSLNEKMDPPQNAEPVDKQGETKDGKQAEGEAEEQTDTVARELYLLDANGMVASQTLELPTTDSHTVAQQVVEYLVQDGPVSQMLPNGFQAVLPAGTEVLGVNLQEDGTIVVDLSKEFSNYEAENERKILEAVTYSLTQFENVDQVQLQIEGKALQEMPVDGTPIGKGFSRANGINISDTGANDLVDSKTVTMFYPAEHNDNTYYVPVTQYVEQEEDELMAIVNALIDGPGVEQNVMQVFNPKATLTSEPSVKGSVLHLQFNEEILKDADKAVISDHVMESLVRTMTGIKGIESVQVGIDNVEQVVNEEGEAYTEPVTIQQFTQTEEL